MPNDALEKMLWAEADKLGWFINTVTEPVLAKEKQVVKNEKRQGVDNQPYGHTSYVIDRNLYPESHPYSWQVIGSLEDLQNATLQDVRNFYTRWYVPNNATLVVAGDFDTEQARAWVEKYFAEIPRGEEIASLEAPKPELAESPSLYHEDNFARSPRLTMTWPTVEQYHPDAYPLAVLAQLLTDGKSSPFQQVLVEEEQVAPGVSMYHSTSELAGSMQLGIQAYSGTDLDTVRASVDRAFARFEEEGVAADDLQRIKAGQETNFYQGLSSVLGKAFQLAQYNIFAGDPGYVNEDIRRIMEVDRGDVMRVYESYLKGRHYVATSFVPRGESELALAGAERAEVQEEEIVMGAEEGFDLSAEADYERTPSTFDRTVEPPYGEAPQTRVPEVWEEQLDNGMEVYGIASDELPLVQFTLRMKGGLLLDDPALPGVASLTAELMNKGTRDRTPAELEKAIDLLGASINVSAGRESFSITGTTLARNYGSTMDLVREMLLEPRWDSTEFELARQQTLNALVQQQANPGSVAGNAWNRLVYGEEHILSHNALGTEASVRAITLDDLKTHYRQKLSPSLARFHVAGDVERQDVLASLEGLDQGWQAREVTLPDYTVPEAPESSTVWFYDVPGAVQSQLRIGYPALAETHPDHYPATVMNYILGGGGFASRLTQELREGKGYTYGIGSGFGGSELRGPFTISTGVRSNVTYESAELIRQILADYPDTFSEEDLATTKSFLLKSNARAFETLGAKLGMLQDISAYGWPYDYVRQREEVVREMTVERIRELAERYVNPARMHWLVVGDADTQLERLQGLGYGEPVRLHELQESDR
ncbi:MAG: pitrilysin family protein [Balneolaceae bacterium]|nr:pitrilysin family protein [Balneolaceae bacterium]